MSVRHRCNPIALSLLFIFVAAGSGAVADAQDASSLPPAPVKELHEDRPSALPKHLLSDLRRLSSKGTIITLAAGGALAAAAHPTDSQAVQRLSANHALEESLDGGSVAGNGFVQAGAAATLYAVGAWAHKPSAGSLGAELLEAQAVTGLLTQSLKVAVHRVRPDGGRHSFPSGHASATFATAEVVAERYGWRYGLAAYIGASYVAASRVADRRHFTSDVVFGAALGIASAHAVSMSHRQHLTIAAVPLRGGAMVVVARAAR